MMAFTVQNDAGTIANANAYITVAEFKAYHDDRGNSYGADPAIQVGIIKATDFLDRNFRWKGNRLVTDPMQTTEFPRENVFDREGFAYTGIPKPIKQACAEYALRALGSPLLVDTPAPSGGRELRRERVKLDVLETETEYMPGGGDSSPSYPLADLILEQSNLLADGGSSNDYVERA